jgi:hypothetical protein
MAIPTVDVRLEAVTTRHADLVILLAERIAVAGLADTLGNLYLAVEYSPRSDLMTHFQRQIVSFAAELGWPSVWVAMAQSWPARDRFPKEEYCR